MRVCIHRGTNEIGGTCVELESQGKRLVLDVGLPLDTNIANHIEPYPVPGFTKSNELLLGVCISHSHIDHYGLAHRLPKETPYLIGKAAQQILAAATVFSPYGIKLQNVTHMEDRKPITLGPFTITPFLVDHSAYDAYALLVEADGISLFYTGDIRSHGRKRNLFEKLLADPPAGVDVLLMEGTTVGREGAEKYKPSEAHLEKEFVEHFRQTEGMAFVCCSGQNIDRLVTVFRACRKTGRQLILDMYTAHILQATGNDKVPQANWDGIMVYLPKSQKARIIQDKRFDVSDNYKPWRIYERQLQNVASLSVMLIRPNMTNELEAADCLSNAICIYSLWRGYLDQDQNKVFLEWLKKHSIPLHHCHTSGHASVTDLKRLRAAFTDAVLVPVHLDQRERYRRTFEGVEVHEDGEWWKVEKGDHKMARFAYIEEIAPDSWLHWTISGDNGSCIRDYRYSPVKTNNKLKRQQVKSLLSNPGNFWEMAPNVRHKEVEFWREQISLKNIESGFAPIDEPMQNYSGQRLLDLFKAQADPLLNGRRVEDLRRMWHEWVQKFGCVVNKEQFNRWDNSDAGSNFSLDKGVGWTSLMLEHCRHSGTINWINTGDAATTFSLIAMELHLGISSKRNLFQPGKTDFIKPDGLGIRKVDGTLCVVEIKGPKDPETLYDATLQCLCGLLAVYAKREMIEKIARSDDAVRRIPFPAATIPNGVRSLGLYVIASPQAADGSLRDNNDQRLTAAARLIVESCPYVREIVYSIVSPSHIDAFTDIPISMRIP